MNKTKFVVICEEKFCYINPNMPNVAFVLASAIGATGYAGDSITIAHGDYKMERVRPATRADFEKFRVSSDGFEQDSAHYEFPAE